MHVIDIALFERELFSGGHRGPMVDAHGTPRAPKTMISLPAALASLGVDAGWRFHNSGNDAFSYLLVLQMLIDRDNTKLPMPTTPHRGKNLDTSTPGTPGWTFRSTTPTYKSLPTTPMNPPSPLWGTGGDHLAPNEFGTLHRAPGRPSTFYGAYNRNPSAGDLLT